MTKTKWVLISKFSSFGVFTSFFMLPCFLKFSWHELHHGLGSSIWMLARPLLHFLCCIGMCVASILLSYYSIECYFFLCSHPPLVFDLHDGGALYENTCTCIF